jgi:hypothetical protein
VEMPPDDVRTGANVKDLTAHRRTRVRALPDPQPPADDDYSAWIGFADEVQEHPARSTHVDASAVGSAPSIDADSPAHPDDVLKQFSTPPAPLPEPGPTAPAADQALSDLPSSSHPENNVAAETDFEDASDFEDDEDGAEDTAPAPAHDLVPTWAGTGAHPVAHRQTTPRGSAELAAAAKRARKRSPAPIPAEPRSRARARETPDRSDRLKVERRPRPSILRPHGIPRVGRVLAAVVLLAVGLVALSLEGSRSTSSSTPKSSAHVEASAPTLPDASHLTNGPTLLSALNVVGITHTGSRAVEKSIARYVAARRAAARQRAAKRARRHRQLLARRRAEARRAHQHHPTEATSSSASASTYTPPSTTSTAPTTTSATTTSAYTPPAQTSAPATSSSSSQAAGPTGAGSQSGGCDPLCK